MKNIYWPLVALMVSACSSHPTSPDVTTTKVSSERKIASLDNNGEPVDDGFDPNLETYFGGNAEKEKAANDAVAAVIRKAVEKQQHVRQEVMNSSAKNSKEAQRIFKDLPAPNYATRDVHRKTNGCFKAQLTVADNFMQSLNEQIASYQQSNLTPVTSPEDLGIFAPRLSYDAIVRFSNGNPGNNPDKVADARGFAVKILPTGSLNSQPIAQMDATELNLATKLDVLSINFPTFFVSDPTKYVALNRGALESARDFKNSIIGQAQQFEAVFVAAGFTSLERKLTLITNGSVIYSPLYQDYFSMVPSRLGPEGAVRAVKYSWAPAACSPASQTDFIREKLEEWPDWAKDHSYAFPPHSPAAISKLPDDYLRANVMERLTQADFCFNLYVQLYRDPVSTNIEDSTDLWASTEAEKSWWEKSVVPGPIEWRTSPDNQETRANYLKRFEQKQIAPRVLAAQLTIKQLAGAETATSYGNNKTCEDLSFNPWNGDIAHHKPLGIVSRMKRKVYNASRRERHELNGIDDKNIERH